MRWLLAIAWLSGTRSVIQYPQSGTDNFLQDEVTVPSGAKPGQQVVVMTTMAAQFIVTVPPGVLAGHTFPVHIPATAGRVSSHAFIDARTEMPSATEDTNDETQYRVQDIQTAMADRMDNDTVHGPEFSDLLRELQQLALGDASKASSGNSHALLALGEHLYFSDPLAIDAVAAGLLKEDGNRGGGSGVRDSADDDSEADELGLTSEVRRGLRHGISLITRAALADNWNAKASAALLYAAGLAQPTGLRPRPHETRSSLIKRGIRQQSWESYLAVGYRHLYGYDGFEKSCSRAVDHFMVCADETMNSMREKTGGAPLAPVMMADLYANPDLQTAANDEAASPEYHRSLADTGDAEAANTVGESHFHGDEATGVEHNFELAAHYFRIAAEAGHGHGQANMGMLYANGFGGLKQDNVTAHKWFSKAAKQNISSALNGLGYLYLYGAESEGHVVGEDSHVAPSSTRRPSGTDSTGAKPGTAGSSAPPSASGAQHGGTSSAAGVHDGGAAASESGGHSVGAAEDGAGAAGTAGEPGGEPRQGGAGVGEGAGAQGASTNSPQGAEGAEAATTDTSPGTPRPRKAKHAVKRNVTRALELFELAAEHGFSEADNNLGLLYMQGTEPGVAQNLTKAMQHFRYGEGADLTSSMYYLGWMHLSGWGTPKNCTEGVLRLKKVAERGPCTELSPCKYLCYASSIMWSKPQTIALTLSFACRSSGIFAQMALRRLTVAI